MHEDLEYDNFSLKAEENAQSNYSAIAVNAVRGGAVATLRALSYVAETAAQGADMVIVDMVPSFIRMPSVPSWLPLESIGVLSTLSPLLTLGNDIRRLDPTGAAELYIALKAAKTSLVYTKIAADIAATAIETASVQETIISGAQSIAESYMPYSIKEAIGPIFSK